MLESFSTKAVQLIEEAKSFAMNEAQTMNCDIVVTTYHLLLSMFLSKDTICHFLLTEEEITYDDLINTNKEVTNTEEIGNIFTKEFEDIVLNASKIAKEVSSEYVYDEHLFYSILEKRNNVACEILISLGFKINTLKKDIEDIFNFYNNEIFLYQPKKETTKLNYLVNISKIQNQHPYISRSTYINQMIFILNKKQKNNPLLIGSAGVGKTALVEGLSKIYEQDIYQLDLGGVIAGTKYRGEMEEKILNAIEYVKKQNGILFIDEVHNIVGAGSNDGSLDAANILKPYLSRGEIKVIAATTLDEYYKYIEKDKALVRRFQNIFIDEPTTFETVNILKGIKHKYEQYYDILIDDELIEYIVNKTLTLIPNRKFPDKAIDVLDETLSRNKLYPANLKEIVNEVISSINGIKVPKKEDLSKCNLNYQELMPFYLRKLYPLKTLKNLGVIKVCKEFKIELLMNDLNKIFDVKEEMLLTIDLNDYLTNESLTDLIGSNKGYVGFEQGGLLYNHLLKYPLTIIYLKNFHASTIYLKYFFQKLFKKRKVTDSHLRTIYLTNTLFLVEDETDKLEVGFINSKTKTNKYYDCTLKKNIYKEDHEITSYLLKKGILIEGFKNLNEQDQINVFYHAISKPMGKYKLKFEEDTIILETVPS